MYEDRYGNEDIEGRHHRSINTSMLVGIIRVQSRFPRFAAGTVTSRLRSCRKLLVYSLRALQKDHGLVWFFQ